MGANILSWSVLLKHCHILNWQVYPEQSSGHDPYTMPYTVGRLLTPEEGVSFSNSHKGTVWAKGVPELI